MSSEDIFNLINLAICKIPKIGLHLKVKYDIGYSQYNIYEIKKINYPDNTPCFLISAIAGYESASYKRYSIIIPIGDIFYNKELNCLTATKLWVKRENKEEQLKVIVQIKFLLPEKSLTITDVLKLIMVSTDDIIHAPIN